jgi:magnesium-transporting ATPase (P-type)
VAEAASRLAADGPNALPAPHPVRLWRRVVAQLRDPLVLVLLAAAVLTTATGDWTDATVIILVIVVNTAAGVIQEVKADHAISALTQLTAPDARVIRDGDQQQIPAADVVTGDLLVLAEGDIVPADAQVTEAAALLIDESALTGESVPVDKAPGTGPGADAVSAGTVVVRGRGPDPGHPRLVAGPVPMAAPLDLSTTLEAHHDRIIRTAPSADRRGRRRLTDLEAGAALGYHPGQADRRDHRRRHRLAVPRSHDRQRLGREPGGRRARVW